MHSDGGTPPTPTCVELSDEELRAIGYEPVRAHGAVGDGVADDTDAIQAAIDEANRIRRSVYFHPGEYLVSRTLEVHQDIDGDRGTGSDTRYGMTLLGSYCGERPTLRLEDGTAPETDEATVSAEPTRTGWSRSTEAPAGPARLTATGRPCTASTAPTTAPTAARPRPSPAAAD